VVGSPRIPSSTLQGLSLGYPTVLSLPLSSVGAEPPRPATLARPTWGLIHRDRCTLIVTAFADADLCAGS
jgi:hypothetical protein